MDASPTLRSLGDVIAPFVRKKPKPKSPNAVQALKNKRTEMANRERNNAANGNNGADNPNSYLDIPWESSDVIRPTTSTPLVLFDNNVLKREELPPPRSKPLARDIQILLAVLGTVGGILILLYLAKKIFYDNIHKNNKSGKISHAYAHFRRFQKKRKSRSSRNDTGDGIKTVCDIDEKMSQSSESGLGTMNANEAAATKDYEEDHSMPNSKCTVGRFPNLSSPPGRLEDGFKNIPSAQPNGNTTHIPPYDRQRATYPRYSSDLSDSSSSDQQRYQRRRKRKRRRKRSSQTERVRNEQVMDQSTTRNRDSNCTFIAKDEGQINDSRYYRDGSAFTPRVDNQLPQTCYLSKKHIDSISISNENPTHSKSTTWRDRAYS